MATLSYFDVASVLSSSSMTYSSLDYATKNHVRSLVSDGFAIAKYRGKKVLLSNPKAEISLTEAGRTYISLLQEAGVILAPTTPATTSGRHAKTPEPKAPKTPKPAPKPRAKKTVQAFTVPAPQELEAMRQVAEGYYALINFIDQRGPAGSLR